jgi:hypothetical protein
MTKKTKAKKAKNKDYKTYFVTAKVEVVYEVFCDSKETAVQRLEEALLDKNEREDIFEDAYSMTDIESVEDAHEHFENN